MNDFLDRILASAPVAALGRARVYRTALLAILVAIALASWVAEGARRPVVLLFPRATDGRLVGELRALPSREPEAEAAETMAELLLGPSDPDLAPLFAPGTRVDAVLLRDEVLRIDLDEGALGEGGAPIRRALYAARRVMAMAEPGLDGILLTIGGQVPFGGADEQKK
ncbi:MAG: GerMN domain-containing protein [Spirochaetales bacterium]|nr:GerMN domain-containing protein [Spirochaetales bacterium]